MKSLTYAITGANGQIGSFLTAFLRKQGHTVYELVRRQEKAIDPIFYKLFDLSQPDKIPSLQGVDVLIHAAHYFDTTDKNYSVINIAGTQKLFQQARQDVVPYSIFISTLSAHAAASSLYGQVKYQLERIIQKENMKAIIIRPGLVLHSPLQGIAAAMDNFIKRYPIVPLIGRGKQLIYPCLLEDLVQSIYLLSVKQQIVTQPILAATEKGLTFKQLVKYLAFQRQKRVLLFPIPFSGIYYLLKLIEFFGIPFKIRSDSLLGIHYADPHPDFSATKNLGLSFSVLNI